MSQILSLLQGSLLLHNSSFYDRSFDSSTLLPQKSCLYYGHYTKFQQCRGLQSSLQGSWETIDSTEKCSTHSKAKVCDGDELNAFSHVQTLRKFPVEQLFGKVVMVRIDSTLLLRQALESNTPSVERACFTLKYLYRAGAKVVIAGNWGRPSDSMHLLSAETAADYLSSVLQLKVVPTNWISDYKQYKMEDLEKADILLLENLSQFKEELANCSEFARKLSSGVDIFVNDNFSQSHKILASTVGVSRHCYASIAGFCFEEELSQVMEVTKTTKQPYIAIIGGGNLFDKAAAMHLLASKCDGLVFVGMMAFQIMHALGMHVPLSFVDHGAVEDSFKIIQLARERNIALLCPKDFWCMNDSLGEQFDVFHGHEILDGWTPVDLGPISLNEISFLLSKCKAYLVGTPVTKHLKMPTCKKILWIGPVKFRLSQPDTQGTSKLAVMLETSSRKGCDVTVVGNAACKAIMRSSTNFSCYSLYEKASAVWEFLKGRMLPGLVTLDRAYPFEIDWGSIFYDPAQPLVVDIGSGNGLFLLGMAGSQKDLNFLGLEINKKLVRRCLDSVHQSGLQNGYFIATNATFTFQSIVSSYPGELVLVSIQCPNPNFNKPEHRWRMLQRPLVEAIADLLTTDGKVFLQSDVEAVAVRMREQFMMYGKGKLAILNNKDDLKTDHFGWLEENPFGIRSDWEQHVIDRGSPMYRLMFSRVDQCRGE